MKPWIILPVASLLLFGCAQTRYINPSNTQADFGADKVECDNQAIMSTRPLSRGPLGRPGVRQSIENQGVYEEGRRQVDECLRLKGWILEPNSR